jgi:hypothetical protein
LSSQTLIHFYADNSSIVNKLIILEMSNGLNQSHIRDIVSQVKSGLKTKTEAFNELKSILQASNKKLEPTTTDDDLIDESDKNIAGGRFSQEDRRLLINKLIEKKRLGRGGKNDLLPDTPEYDDNQPDLPSEMKSRMYSDSYRDDMLNNSRGDESYTARQSRSVNNYPPGRPESRGRSTSTRAVTPKERSRSASQSQRRDSYDVNNIYENSENYINRIAQSEAMVREEMFRDFKKGGYNLEDTKLTGERLLALVLLITFAYTEATFCGNTIQKSGVSNYVGRTRETNRSTRRHSRFYLGLYGKNWVDSMDIFKVESELLMSLSPQKLDYYKKGKSAANLVNGAF